MSFKPASSPNNKPISNKSPQIVGANLADPSSAQIKRSYETKENQKLSSIAPSDEFRAFWGNNVDPSWFEGKKPMSPFLIFIGVLVILNLYLCTKLIFAPGEFQQLFMTLSSSEEISDAPANTSKLQTFDEEKIMLSRKKLDDKATSTVSETTTKQTETSKN